eukprot:m.46915 g.46915  ORF g.46915 m.46915 type:complete len:167 (-) comp13183_c0_seq2:398-898(-)
MASFTMVARDSRTGKAYQVNRLHPRSDEERRIYDRASALKDARKERASKSLDRLPPTEEERLVVHDLFLRTRDLNHSVKLPESMRWISDTAHESINMCHPQDRNIHNSIFGGFLMREAFELAWMSASMFSNTVTSTITNEFESSTRRSNSSCHASVVLASLLPKYG